MFHVVAVLRGGEPNMRLRRLIAIACSLLPLTLAAQPISYEKLAAYAASPLDRMVLDERSYVIGTIDGVDIRVDFVCSDLCPNYAQRIIRFDLPEGTSCSQVGGEERMLDVPMGIGRGERQYCFPQAIIGDWETLAKPRGRVPLIIPGDVRTMRMRSACKGREGQTIQFSEGTAECPERLPTYVSYVDLIVLPARIDGEFITVVGTVRLEDGLPALLPPAEDPAFEPGTGAVRLWPADELARADECLIGAVRVMGTFHDGVPPAIEVNRIRTSDNRSFTVCYDATE